MAKLSTPLQLFGYSYPQFMNAINRQILKRLKSVRKGSSKNPKPQGVDIDIIQSRFDAYDPHPLEELDTLQDSELVIERKLKKQRSPQRIQFLVDKGDLSLYESPDPPTSSARGVQTPSATDPVRDGIAVQSVGPSPDDERQTRQTQRRSAPGSEDGSAVPRKLPSAGLDNVAQDDHALAQPCKRRKIQHSVAPLTPARGRRPPTRRRTDAVCPRDDCQSIAGSHSITSDAATDLDDADDPDYEDRPSMNYNANEEVDDDESDDNDERADQVCHCPGNIGPRAQSVRKTKASNLFSRGLFCDMCDVPLQDLCRRHIRNAAGAAGLLTSQGGITNEEFINRFRRFVQAYDGCSMYQLKTDLETYPWFNEGSRPPRPAHQSLGDWKYPHRKRLSRCVPKDRAEFIISQSVIKEFTDTGNVIIPSCFAWWKPTGLLEIFRQERAMYQHHYRRNRFGGMGWLRCCFHSLAQQAMRMDPRFFLYHACLRPDGCHWLVSYPYYIKQTRPGDNTGFHHFDMNPYLMTAFDWNQMQSSLSLSDEDEENCTVLVPGFHKNLDQWVRDTQSRSKQAKGLVFNLTRDRYNGEYGEFEKFPCHTGDVRFTLSSIPHGSTPKATMERVVMFPWFVPLNAKHELFENVKAGTWLQLQQSAINLTVPPAMPSGEILKHCRLPYRFPAAVQLHTPEFYLPQALLGRIRHDDPMVVEEKECLFGERIGAEYYIQAVQDAIVESVHKAWERVKMLEKIHFEGNDSYFRCQETGQSPSPAYDPPPTNVWIDERD
ncbi:hypothetical protein MBLNU457_7836t2 [Dothideomycetes sp. NU457]